jgi:MFS family permease
LTPQVVPPEHYFNAITWSTSIWQLSAILGPALGGLIIGISQHAAVVYIANAVAGGALVVALIMLRSRQAPREKSDETPIQSVREGWHFLRRTPIIFSAITLDMFAVLFGGAVFLLPIFASDILQVDASGLGLMRAAPSIGALLMATYLARRAPFQKSGQTLLLAVAGFGIATIIFGVSTSFWLSMAMLALLGALDNISVVIRHILVLTHTPDEMRGRVGAVNAVFIGASNELGGFESGVAASLLGPVGAVVFGGLGTLVVVGLIARVSPQLRRLGAIRHEAQQELT